MEIASGHPSFLNFGGDVVCSSDPPPAIFVDSNHLHILVLCESDVAFI